MIKLDYRLGLGMALAALVAGFARADGVFTPAITVTFADTRVIAAELQALGKPTGDTLLTRSLPSAILNTPASRYFGAMRAGAVGVSVGYVDAQVVSRILASPPSSVGSRKRSAEIERAKHWTLCYPASIGPAAFRRAHPEVKTVQGCHAIPPPRGQRGATLYAVYSADGKWVGISASPILAKHTLTAAAAALKRPLGRNLAFVSMSAAGARALFQSKDCAAGTAAIRMTAAGLEIDATVQMKALTTGVLPPGALTYPGVKANSPLFGVTRLAATEIRGAQIFSLVGPEVASFIGRSLAVASAGTYTVYQLPAWARPGRPAPKVVGVPRARSAAILPEAAKRTDLESVMFCSPTEMLRQSLPRIAAKMPIKDAMLLEVSVRLLKPVRGDGMGCMTWRQGAYERVFIRISRDELRGTVGLWSMMFL